MTESLTDGRSYPAVSAEIGVPQRQPEYQAERAAPPDRLGQRLDDLEHRIDVLQGILADHILADKD